MAATVIDELIVLLGLDPTNFTEGQKKAADSLVGFKKQAQESTKEMGEFFENLRSSVVTMFAAFTAGRGIKDFIQDTARVNNQISRLSFSLGQTVQEMSLWRGAGQLIGSSAEDITGSIAGMTQELQNFALTGQSSVLPFLRAMAPVVGQNFDMIDRATGKMRSATDLFKYLAAYASKEPDKARAAALFRDMGISQGMINLLLPGTGALNRYLELSARLGVVTEQDAKAARDLETAWMGVNLSSETLGRTLMTEVAPILVRIGQWMTDLAVVMRQHPVLLNAIAAGLGAVTAALGVLAAVAAGSLLGISTPIALALAGIAALAVALGLLADDWKTWEEGGKSSFGAFWRWVEEKWARFGPLVRSALGAILGIFKDTAVQARDWLKFIEALFFGSGDDIRHAWAKLAQDTFDMFAHLAERLPSVFNLIGYGFAKAIAAAFNWAEGRVNAFWHAITGHDLFKPVDFNKLVPPPEGAKTPAEAKKEVDDHLKDVRGQQPTAPQAPAAPPSAGKGPYPSGVKTDQQRVAWDASVAGEKKYGIPAAVSYAQWQLESASGTRLPFGSNNPFGIKAKAGEPYVEAQTREFEKGQWNTIIARFRKFDSLADAFDAHGKLLASAGVYAKARATKNATDFADALTGVYAKDPNYGTQLKRLMAKAGTAPVPTGQKLPAPSQIGVASVNDNRSTVTKSETTVENHIGTVNIQTKATDAKGIARDIGGALDNELSVQANYGQN